MKIKEWDAVTILRPSLESKEKIKYLCVSNLTYERLIKRNQWVNYLIIDSALHKALSSLQIYDTFKEGIVTTRNKTLVAIKQTTLLEVIVNKNIFKIFNSKIINSLFYVKIKYKWFISILNKKVFLKMTKNGK